MNWEVFFFLCALKEFVYGVYSSFDVWLNLPIESSEPRVFFVRRFLINYLISLTSMTIQMFYLFLCQAYVQYVIVSLFVQLKIILFSIVNSTLIHSLFTSFCFLFKELGIVQFICYSFLFNSAVVREYILYDFSSRKCVESCFRPSK